MVTGLIDNITHNVFKFYGTGSTLGSAFIPEVDTTRSFIMLNGFYQNTAGRGVRVELHNGSTVIWRKNSGGDTGSASVVAVELNAARVNTIQTGSISFTGGVDFSGTSTLSTTVDQTKSAIFNNGVAGSTASFDEYCISLALSGNGTTVSAIRGDDGVAGDDITVNYTVVEFV
jgi:hypothetical protein